MSFTNEEQIEEILIESHSYGIRLEVMEEARAIMGSDPKLRKVDAYERAFRVVKQRFAFLLGKDHSDR